MMMSSDQRLSMLRSPRNHAGRRERCREGASLVGVLCIALLFSVDYRSRQCENEMLLEISTVSLVRDGMVVNMLILSGYSSCTSIYLQFVGGGGAIEGQVSGADDVGAVFGTNVAGVFAGHAPALFALFGLDEFQ